MSARFPLAVFVAGLLYAPAAQAQFPYAERFVEVFRPSAPMWQSAGQWLRPALLRGLIDGARLQSMHVAGPERHREVLAFCVPETLASDEAMAAVIRFVEANPQVRQEAAVSAAWVALSERWPCPRP